MSAFGDWLWWLTAIGVLAFCAGMVYLAWWALFADRARGRRRCARCWYDLAYSPGMTCAECGFTAREEAQFGHTRRRKGLAALAIISGVIAVLFVQDQVNQRGWTSYLPTFALLWMLPLADDMNGSIGGEIVARANAGQLSDGQWLTLIERSAGGDLWARPTSDGWVGKYGSFIELWRPSFAGDAALEAPLLAIAPRLEATTREVWPEGLPIAVGVQVRDWWPWGSECRVKATPRVLSNDDDDDDDHARARGSSREGEAGRSLTFYRSSNDSVQSSPYTIYLSPAAGGGGSAPEIVIDFEISRRRADAPTPRRRGRGSNNSLGPAEDENAASSAAPAAAQLAPPEWEVVHRETVRLATRVEGNIDEFVTAASSDEMTAMMQQVFGQAVKWSGGMSPVRFSIGVPMTFGPAFDDTAIGVTVDLERDGVLARRLNLWWIGGTKVDGAARAYGFEIEYENLPLLDQLIVGDDAWQLRIRGNPALALRTGKVKQYWSGELTIPLQLRTVQSDAPPRSWWTDADLEDLTIGDH